MLTSKTVFIVGAGASKEVKLPLGTELKQEISTKLNIMFDDYGRHLASGDLEICDMLRAKFRTNFNPYQEACLQISRGITLFASIDDFINTHQHEEKIELCGKLAIAKSILDAERDSLLFINPNINERFNVSAIDDKWYTSFFQLLIKDVTKDNLNTIFDNVVIICFNYDRCIEHFLVLAISQAFLVPTESATDIVRKLKIYRPYGSIGDYLSGAVPFGSSRMPAIDETVAKLKTYTEQMDNQAELEEFQKHIRDAATLIFLGNAYHDNNMKLLFDYSINSNIAPSPKRIFATRNGISEADIPHVERYFNNITGATYHVSIEEEKKYYFADTCSKLFSDFRMSLRN